MWDQSGNKDAITEAKLICLGKEGNLTSFKIDYY